MQLIPMTILKIRLHHEIGWTYQLEDIIGCILGGCKTQDFFTACVLFSKIQLHRSPKNVLFPMRSSYRKVCLLFIARDSVSRQDFVCTRLEGDCEFDGSASQNMGFCREERFRFYILKEIETNTQKFKN